MDFQLTSRFQPTGDQPQAIEELVRGFQQGLPYQTLLGVTGSGKTFTAANVIAQVKKPTLVLSHNKTLAAQLYAEFKASSPTTQWSTSSTNTNNNSPRPISQPTIPKKRRIWRSMPRSRSFV